MTTFLLIRHAVHSFDSERIAGHTPEVHLSLKGQADAQQLTQHLKDLPIKAIYSSPLERTLETAVPLAAQLDLTVEVHHSLRELEYGAWTGQKFEDLRAQDDWEHWNIFRSGHRIPCGESMLEVQARIVEAMLELQLKHEGECIALFSHGDVIKAAAAYFLGVPLDLFSRIEISPASVTSIRLADYGPQVMCVNHTGNLQFLSPR